MPLNDFRSIHLPYCLDKQNDGSYVVLNREYKPIGFASKKSVEYEDFPVRVKFKGLTANLAAKVSYSNDKDIGRIYLYNDGCVPTSNAKNMTAYLGRLALLAKLKATPVT